jgi:hypothetical protein
MNLAVCLLHFVGACCLVHVVLEVSRRCVRGGCFLSWVLARIGIRICCNSKPSLKRITICLSVWYYVRWVTTGTECSCIVFSWHCTDFCHLCLLWRKLHLLFCNYVPCRDVRVVSFQREWGFCVGVIRCDRLGGWSGWGVLLWMVFQKDVKDVPFSYDVYRMKTLLRTVLVYHKKLEESGRGGSWNTMGKPWREFKATARDKVRWSCFWTPCVPK